MEVSIDIRGEANLRRVLRSLEERHQRVLVRPALTAGGSPISKEMKRRAPTASGTLKKSIGVKRAKAFRGDPSTMYVAIGPRRRFTREVRRGRKTQLAIPTKYAHFAERATHFQEAAVAAATPAARAKMAASLRKNIGRAFDRGRI